MLSVGTDVTWASHTVSRRQDTARRHVGGARACSGFGTRDSGLVTRDVGFRARDAGLGTQARGSGRGIWVSGCGTLNSGRVTRGSELSVPHATITLDPLIEKIRMTTAHRLWGRRKYLAPSALRLAFHTVSRCAGIVILNLTRRTVPAASTIPLTEHCFPVGTGSVCAAQQPDIYTGTSKCIHNSTKINSHGDYVIFICICACITHI